MKLIIVNGIGEIPDASTGITFDENCHVIKVNHAGNFPLYTDADAFIDLHFSGKFYSPPGKPLLINETINTLKELTNPPALTARFCGWKGFIERPIWEIATIGNEKDWLLNLMNATGKLFEMVTDEPGLVAPRILSMIINEAYFALEDGVSSAGEIDLAMKLGTNYPEGPIAWAHNIGTENIYKLLKKLEKTDKRYKPHQLLKPKGI